MVMTKSKFKVTEGPTRQVADVCKLAAGGTAELTETRRVHAIIRSDDRLSVCQETRASAPSM